MIGNDQIENLDRLPTNTELEQAWKIAAEDLIAEKEMDEAEKRIDELIKAITADLLQNDPVLRAKQQAIAEANARVAAVEARVQAQVAAAEAKLEAQVAVVEAKLAAEQEATQKELDDLTKQVETAKKKQKETAKLGNMATLLELTADGVPSLLQNASSEEEKARTPNIFTKCKISQVLQSIAELPNEDAFMAEVNKQPLTIQAGHTGDATKTLEAVAACPLLQHQLQAIERVARSRGQRVNKLFNDSMKDKAITESDYTCTGPDEIFSCFANTLFYFQAKQKKKMARKTQAMKSVGDGDDFVLREGVARVVARILSRSFQDSSLARFALGVVCDGKHIVIVRVDLEDEDGFPVHVSEVLPINRVNRKKGKEGMRYLARMMCCSSAEQFGLSPRPNFLALLPSSYHYVRTLGSGAFAEVVAVGDTRTAAGQPSELLACKVARHGHSHVLAYETRILKKLQTIATGIPRLVQYYESDEQCEEEGGGDKNIQSLLLMSPVGTPLLEHMKSLHGEAERHAFARKVFEELKPVLAAGHAKGIVHGDIKPDNIVVAANGEVLLIDWGCAIELRQEEEEEEEDEEDEEDEEEEEEEKSNEQGQNQTPTTTTTTAAATPVPSWTMQIRTRFMSDGLLMGMDPTPEDDEQSLLFTYLAIRESPIARAPWPCDNFEQLQFIGTRSLWLKEYARKHPELNLLTRE